MKRRTLLAAGAALAMPAVVRAGSKPEKLVFVGDNGPWHFCLVEEVAPAFEKATGIKIDFTLLPIDALSARLKAELNSGSPGIDVVQWTAPFAGWLAPHMADHTKLLADNAGRHPDFDWDDFLPPVRDFASYQGKLLGIPYRVTTSILNYQKPLLADAGFTTPPGDWDSFLKALQATTKPPERYGLGIWGRQGPAMVGGFSPFLRGNGGRYFDPATMAIEINDTKAVEALEYYGDLMTRYKVVVPDSITWEFDEIIAGGQNDRYAMTITLAPYGTLINDPKQSKTAGRWGWALAPGRHSVADSRVSLGGWTFGVPEAGKNNEWAFEFIQFATSKEWMRRSLERGNAPPRTSVLNDPTVLDRFGWAPVLAQSLRTAQLEPREPFWPAMELQLRSGISSVLLGQKTAKVALDAVALDWQRTLRRAGVKPT
ncbi:MAG: multiple sugar transport system substrate-binding protein [Acetobacteraceae bacterium]|jgi:multiple sugar transport system substrate-binding protein|nr:multiple sugar transport system substrate-binding protein [Acetobacteraceae bacterium]